MNNETSQRVVVVTGASAGIGKATAEAFARMGWFVIGTGRDPDRCEEAEVDIRRAASSDARVEFLQADFCEMAQVKRLAGEIAELTASIDVLVNNAGGVRDRLYKTSEGLEATFAANHLAAFLLTRELTPLLQSAAQDRPAGAVRVLAVSSSGHAMCPGMDWNDLNLFDNFTTGRAYCQAKLANVLFTRELNRRLSTNHIIAQAMHPGVIASNFATHGDEQMQGHMATLESMPPESPARTLIWMATAPEVGVQGGRYFHNLAEAEAAPQALDDDAAARLWSESERLLETLGH